MPHSYGARVASQFFEFYWAQNRQSKFMPKVLILQRKYSDCRPVLVNTHLPLILDGKPAKGSRLSIQGAQNSPSAVIIKQQESMQSAIFQTLLQSASCLPSDSDHGSEYGPK
jgi:hypothetical protein